MTYKIRPRDGYKPHTFDEFEILNGTQTIGWLMKSRTDHIPILYIFAQDHEIDKHALAVEVKRIDPDSWGEFFLITEYVTFEDLEEPEK